MMQLLKRNRMQMPYVIMVDFETILQAFLLLDEIVADRIGGVCFTMSASTRATFGVVIVLRDITEESGGKQKNKKIFIILVAAQANKSKFNG